MCRGDADGGAGTTSDENDASAVGSRGFRTSLFARRLGAAVEHGASDAGERALQVVDVGLPVVPSPTSSDGPSLGGGGPLDPEVITEADPDFLADGPLRVKAAPWQRLFR